jgi:hypothetical protein
MNGLGKLVIFTVIVMTAGSTAAVYFAPLSPNEGRKRRQAQAQRLVDQLAQATWNYFHDHGQFPPGDGEGTASLVRALRSLSKTGAPYMVFVEEMLTPWGDLRNPAAPQSLVLGYRNNRETSGSAGVRHNLLTFDLWGWSPEGSEDGINNWNSIIVPAP